MLGTRVIPTLLLKGDSLVKTVKFGAYNYIGDPVNTVRVFNELEVDELIFFDIEASRKGNGPNFLKLQEIANECFMPVGYGGGIRTLDQAKEIFQIGLEKVVINSFAYERPKIITELANEFGSQSVIGGIDVKSNMWSKRQLYSHSGKKKQKKKLIDWAKELESLGAGELIINVIDRDGTWAGFDVDLIKSVTSSVDIPVVASGGAGSIQDIKEVVQQGGASAVAVGSMVMYKSPGFGVLVNYPDKRKLEEIFNNGL